MQTCSSSSQSDGGNVEQVVSLPGRARCDWSQQDETNLINFLAGNCEAMGDGTTFRGVVWKTAAAHLERTHVKGAPKTGKACSEKWARVCRTPLQ